MTVDDGGVTFAAAGRDQGQESWQQQAASLPLMLSVPSNGLEDPSTRSLKRSKSGGAPCVHNSPRNAGSIKGQAPGQLVAETVSRTAVSEGVWDRSATAPLVGSLHTDIQCSCWLQTRWLILGLSQWSETLA